MGLADSWRKLRWSLQQRGARESLQFVRAALVRAVRPAAPAELHPFDRLHGTDTGGLMAGGALRVGSRNDAFITGYAGVAPSRFREAIARWEQTLVGERLEDFAFVDLGCGKGRALLLASEFPFREAVGVEINGELAEVAQRNLGRWLAEGKARCPVEANEGDATDFRYPSGRCLVYAYNPFTEPVIRAVLEGLARRAAAGEGRFDLIFLNEPASAPFEKERRLRQLWRAPLPMTEEDRAADPVASPEDIAGLYRWEG